MEIQLLTGVFTIAEAEQLLTDIVDVKIHFHEKKIRTIHLSEEDIKHSEKRIIQLQQTLRQAIHRMKQEGKTHTALNAHIEVNTIGQLTP
ncbi:MAG TPA: hypothetical protein VFR58_03830 [Flavisolibacter sp.]|nr:hypothetical protein [Flavisolibacter sp.]